MKNIFWLGWVSILLLSGVALGLLYYGYIDYGITLFCILPCCIGILTGVMPKKKKAILGTVGALLLIMLVLLITNQEALVCVLMAIPVITFFVLVGWVIGLIIRHFRKKDNELKLSIVPVAIFIIASSIEVGWRGHTVFDQVTTTVELRYKASDIYNHIKQVDTVTASPTFMHQLGLPYPRKCMMTTEQVGGLRICEFEAGKIIETITRLKTNELLEMDVTTYELPGQKWLSFKKDIYEIKNNPSSTSITRTTTYLSNLKPRLYWKWVEQATIGAEQALVFKNLEHELAAGSY